MEGKALLFKYLGVHEPQALVDTLRALAPAFGGINLEDIAQPKCFAVLDAARAALPIPVWYDDQQGTATVALAGLRNALAAPAG